MVNKRVGRALMCGRWLLPIPGQAAVNEEQGGTWEPPSRVLGKRGRTGTQQCVVRTLHTVAGIQRKGYTLGKTREHRTKLSATNQD